MKLWESRCCFFICEIKFLESSQDFDGQSQAAECKGERAARRQQAQLNANTATSDQHREDVLTLQTFDMALSYVLTAIQAHTAQRHTHAQS